MIRITKNEYEVAHTKKDLNIVLFSDLHFNKHFKSKLFRELLEQIDLLKPHYICIAGDLIDSTQVLDYPKKMEELYQFLDDLGKLAPVFYTMAGHDYSRQAFPKWKYDYPSAFFAKLKKIPNFHFLDNSLYQDAFIQIGALTQTFEYFFSKHNKGINHLSKTLNEQKAFLNSFQSNRPSICMVHSPIYLEREEVLSYFQHVDFIFSGHMHNGMVPPFLESIFPKNKGIIYPDKHSLPPLARGYKDLLYNEHKTHLIISGGMIKIHDCSPKILHPFNIFYPPQINVIQIKRK